MKTLKVLTLSLLGMHAIPSGHSASHAALLNHAHEDIMEDDSGCHDVVPLLCRGFNEELNLADDAEALATKLCAADNDPSYRHYCPKTCFDNVDGTRHPASIPQICVGEGSVDYNPSFHGFQESEAAFKTPPSKTKVEGSNTKYEHKFMHRGITGEVTEFAYEAEVHPHMIASHHYEKADIEVFHCDADSVTMSVSSRVAIDEIASWVAHEEGATFHATHDDKCPGNEHVYRKVTSVVEVDSEGKVVTDGTAKGSKVTPLYMKLETTTTTITHLLKNAKVSMQSSDAMVGSTDPKRRERRRAMEVEARDPRRLFSSRRQLYSCTGTASYWYNNDDLSCKEERAFDQKYKMESKLGSTFYSGVQGDLGWRAELHIRGYGLAKNTQAYVYGDAKAWLEARGSGELGSTKGGFGLFDMNICRVPFTLGPLVVTLELNLKADFSYSMSVKSSAPMHIDAHAEGHFKGGITYDGYKWHWLNTKSFSYNYDHSDMPSLEVDMTPAITFTPYLKFSNWDGFRISLPITASVDMVVKEEGSCDAYLSMRPRIVVKMETTIDPTFYGYQLAAAHHWTSTFYDHSYSGAGFCAASWRRDRLLKSPEDVAAKDAQVTGHLTKSQSEDRGPPPATSPCTNDCSGHGYCATSAKKPHCTCFEGWEGELCGMPGPLRYIPETGKAQHAEVPVPGKCAFEPSQASSLGLQVCKDKTEEYVCVDPSLVKSLEADAGLYMRKATALGRQCTHALSNFFCHNAFPSANKDSWAYVPVAHKDCVAQLSKCVPSENAEAMCTSVGPKTLGPLASVAAPESVGPTSTKGKPHPDLATEHAHNAKCVENTTVLASCTHRKGYKSFLDEHVFASVEDADAWVTRQVNAYRLNMENSGKYTDDEVAMCGNVRKDQLCSIHLPVCEVDGSPQKIRYGECQAMWKMCPKAMKEKWSLTSEEDCKNQALFYVRNYVGEDEHACGFNSTESHIYAATGRNVPELSSNEEKKPFSIDSIKPGVAMGIGAGAGCLVAGLVAAVIAVALRKKKKGANVEPRETEAGNGAEESKESKGGKPRLSEIKYLKNTSARSLAKSVESTSSPRLSTVVRVVM